MTGSLLYRASSHWWDGYRAGLRASGRSIFRRFLLAFFVWALLLGSGLGFAWATFDAYMTSARFLTELGAVQESRITVLSKVAAWIRVYRPPTRGR